MSRMGVSLAALTLALAGLVGQAQASTEDKDVAVWSRSAACASAASCRAAS
jgi:hypothetical protein